MSCGGDESTRERDSLELLRHSGARPSRLTFKNFLVLPLCLVPPPPDRAEYPGTVFAFANTVANLAGIVGPLTVTYLVTDSSCQASWFSLWILSGCIFVVGGLLFVLLADNSSQDYCRPAGMRSKGAKSISRAQLTDDKNPVEQIFKMDAFSRLSSQADSSEPTLVAQQQAPKGSE